MLKLMFPGISSHKSVLVKMSIGNTAVAGNQCAANRWGEAARLLGAPLSSQVSRSVGESLVLVPWGQTYTQQQQQQCDPSSAVIKVAAGISCLVEKK